MTVEMIRMPLPRGLGRSVVEQKHSSDGTESKKMTILHCLSIPLFGNGCGDSTDQVRAVQTSKMYGFRGRTIILLF